DMPALPPKTDGALPKPDETEKKFVWTPQRIKVAAVVAGFLLIGVLLIVLSPRDSGSGANDPSTTAPKTELAAIIPGLASSYYEGNWNKLPPFDTLTPVKTGIVPNISLKERKRDVNFGFVFTGSLHVSKPGKHTFVLKSDDGARLFIDDKQLIDDD